MPLFPPPGTADESAVTTVSLSMLGPDRYRCPAQVHMKARHMSPPRRKSGKPERLDNFLSWLLMDRLDEIEFGAGRRSAKPVHEGVHAWLTYATSAYLAACAEAAGNGPELRPVARWTYRYSFADGAPSPGRKLNLTAWARCYSSADGQVRELRLIVNQLARRTREERERAVAAMVAAEGTPDEDTPVPPGVYARVREVGLIEADSRIIFEGDRDAAVELYRTSGRRALRQLLDAEGYQPCSACADCRFTAVCPALAHVDGLTGLADSRRPRRSWSVTDGRRYEFCPARYYLRRQHLPVDDAIEYSADSTRGRAIHDFLAQRHAARLPCVPDIAEDWVPEGFTLSEEDRDLGRGLLKHHAEVCPLRHAAISEVRVEQERFFDDGTANVLVVAKPDLLYLDGDAWVWRELKSHRTSWHRKGGLLAEVPQLALAVLLLHRGALGGARERGRAELETLRPGGADIEVVDPCDPATVSEARRVVAGMIRPWHEDDLFAAKAGPHCAQCEVARWCPSKFVPQETA